MSVRVDDGQWMDGQLYLFVLDRRQQRAAVHFALFVSPSRWRLVVFWVDAAVQPPQSLGRCHWLREVSASRGT